MVLSICGAGAQLSWLYACASFLLFSFFERIYPLPHALAIFSLAVFLTRFHRRHSRRRIQIIGIHLMGIAGAGLWIVHAFYYHLEPWWSSGWLTDFFNRPRAQVENFLLFFVLSYTIVFWVAGIRFAQQASSYTSACARFDRGMIAFFCVFLVKLALHTRMGVQFHDSMALWMIFPFFIFSLTEIGVVRNQGDGQYKEYFSGYYAVGVLASYTIGALIIGTAVVMFFLPYLKAASEVGYDLMQNAAAPLGPILTALIKFIFGYAKLDSTAPDSWLQPDSAGPVESSPWMLVVQKVLMWGGGMLMIAIGIMVAGVLLWYVMRWLFFKRIGAEQTGDPFSLLYWWMRIKAFLYTAYQWLLRTNAKRTARQFYAALRRWGRYSGFAQKSNETPMEYGRRLSHQFPHLKAEILLVIEMLHWEVYGETALHSQQLKSIRQAWKTLHSPLRWPLRIKSIFGG